MSSLKSKLSNLVVVSRRDTSIFTTVNNNHISIVNWVEKNQLKNFFNGSSLSIEFNLNVDFARIENILLKTKNNDELNEVLDYLQAPISKALKNKLMQDFSSFKDELISYVLNYLENIKSKLLQIQRKAKDILKDKGTWNLYLTRYFLKGVTPYRKQVINSPLVLYPVEITSENGKLILTKTNEENEMNEKLIVFLQRDIGKQKKTISDFKTTNNVSNIKRSLEEIIESEIQVSNKGKMDFVAETSNDIANTYNDLYIEDRICLGIYEPSGGKLKEDLEVILNAESHLDIFNKIPTVTIDQIHNSELNSEPILQIDKLDLYQRHAVRASLTDNTIIQGPPGTGKSEVISNIIANLLFFQKDVMMVSEKVAALDVLKKRLKALSVFMLVMYKNDKIEFYDSIVELANFIGNSWIHNKKNIEHDNVPIWKNIKALKDFKKSIKRYDEFVNFKYANLSYIDFINELKSIGGIQALKSVDESGILNIFQDYCNQFNLEIQEFLNFLNDYCDFIDKYELNNKQKYDLFLNSVYELKKYFDNFSINLDDDFSIENIVNNSDELHQYLSSKLGYQKVLKHNPFKFYNDVNLFKEIKRDCIGLINNRFFEEFDDYVGSIKAFLNVFDLAKTSHKKFIFDTFVKELKIVNKKPSSKMFYSKKLSKNDYLVLGYMKKIDDLKLDEYSDFQFIIENQEMFNPLGILYFFNKNIFDRKFFEFISKNFHILNLDLYLLNKNFNVDHLLFNKLLELNKIKHIFDSHFPEFTDDKLFQEIIDESKSIMWKNYDSYIAEVVRNNLIEKLSKLSSHDKQFVQKAINVASSKRRPPIFKYIQEYHLALKQLFPIWIARPDQVSLFVPLRRSYFEYGIYDEASQMFLERAYPLLFRSNINIVAGDDKQLKPSSFFLTRNEDEEDNDYELDDLDTEVSLLDRAQATSWNQIMLQNHYRSDSKELIEFSSTYIYDGKLNYATKNNFSNFSALEVVNSNGYFDDGKNKEEASDVISILEKYIDRYKTILVITFNANQATYINSLLMNNKINNKKVIDKYLSGQIDVINIENVQGNEADLVVLSICYGKKNDNDKIRANFGPIIQSGGKNRLNVAITRAKSKMIVVKSLTAGDISETKNENLETFKKFIAFLDKYEKVNYSKTKVDIPPFDNPFKNELFEYIDKYVSKQGLKVLANFNIGNKNIDIVIMDKNYKKVLLGIQTNNWIYHYGSLKTLKDIENQYFLESRDYKMFRVFEHEWCINKRNVLEKILYALKASLEFN